jgi:hypothetical protein
MIGSIFVIALVCLPTLKRKLGTSSGQQSPNLNPWWKPRWGGSVKYFTAQGISAKLPGQTEDVPMLRDFDALRNLDDDAVERLSFEDPETAVLARLIKDNPDFSPEDLAADLERDKDIVWGMVDETLATVDFNDPVRVEQFKTNFRKWLRDRGQLVEDQHLTEA